MFDNVGVDQDPERPRRQVVALLAAALVVGSSVSAGLYVGAARLEARRPAAPPVADLALVEILDEVPPPELPPAPRRLGSERSEARSGASTEGGRQVRREGSPDAPVEVEEPPEIPPDQVEELKRQPTLTLLDTPPSYHGRAFGSGSDTKDVEGPRTGAQAARGDGGTYVAVAQDELTLRHQVDPVYPPTRSDRATCEVEIRIGTNGRPTGMSVTGCLPPFEGATRRALIDWRWSRPLVGGESVAVKTTYQVNFEPER